MRYFGAETLEVNTLDAGLNSTAVLVFTSPEVTLTLEIVRLAAPIL